jgi:hypothetical protein
MDEALAGAMVSVRWLAPPAVTVKAAAAEQKDKHENDQ